MKDVLLYKGYIGSVHFNADDELLYGKIEGVDDLITFEGNTAQELKKSFEEAVDDYISLCDEVGKKNEKTYKGSFNVRMPSELHKKAKRLAIMKGISLNQFVQNAVEEEVEREDTSL